MTFHARRAIDEKLARFPKAHAFVPRETLEALGVVDVVGDFEDVETVS
jgi:hypothetical protein